MDLLGFALDSIQRQTLPQAGFDVVIVDNGSTPPLDAAALRSRLELDSLNLVREQRVGITFARCAGMRSQAGPRFVDDDNRIAADYLEQALRIASDQPRTGAFGGICAPVFENASRAGRCGCCPTWG